MDNVINEGMWNTNHRIPKPPRKPSPLTRCSSAIASLMETVFYKLGGVIGKYPIAILAGCLVVVAVSGGGFAFFLEETAADKLWTPQNSQAAKDKLWVEENFGKRIIRSESVLIAADNVLEPSVLAADQDRGGAIQVCYFFTNLQHLIPVFLQHYVVQYCRDVLYKTTESRTRKSSECSRCQIQGPGSKMLQLDKNVKAIKEAGSYDWDSMCERFGPNCWSTSLLELWSFDETTILGLTKQQILDKVNTPNLRSPVYFNEYDVSTALGSVGRDPSGNIISAGAASMLWVLKYNDTETELSKQISWEDKFLELTEKLQKEEEGKDVPIFKEFYYFSFKSFEDEGSGTILADLQLLAMGYVIVMVFVVMVMGKFNCMEQKVFVTISGILCVGFSTAVAIGLCSYFGFFFGPVHNILPFLLLGIGVDDMFVIAQSLESVKSDLQGKDIPLHEKIALTMKHAGVSITVTSLTDALAFGVGATTILPALQSFCVYAVVGVLALLMFQALFFTACLTLDMRRQKAGRNACCLCYKHDLTYQPNKCSQTEIIPTFFSRIYAPVLLKTPVKAVVMVGSVVMVGIMAWGVGSLEQDADPNQFFPGDSYAYKYLQASAKYFPGDGYPTAIYLGEFNYYAERVTLEKLYEDVKKDPYTYPGTVQSWHHSFYVWLAVQGAANNPDVVSQTDTNFRPTSATNFFTLLQVYMCNGLKEGARFTTSIVFNVDSICLPRSTSISIKSSKIDLKHRKLENSKQEILAMESLRKLTEQSSLPDNEIRIYTRHYLRFEGNKVIRNELFRNLGLAFLCVAVMTLILIADIWMCILVCTCVLMTLVDLGGLMYYWGLTIDSVTTIQSILSVGLAVDYAVHIAHTYMTIPGDRDYRTRKTLQKMGAAVFYGGFSTFLAFVLLSASASYVFKTFFKLFFGVVVFGLFHGLAFLPCLLSIFGPAPYLSAYMYGQTEKHQKSSTRHKNDANRYKADRYIQYPQDQDRSYVPYILPGPANPGNGLYNSFSQHSSKPGYHHPPVHSSNNNLYRGSNSHSHYHSHGNNRNLPNQPAQVYNDFVYGRSATQPVPGKEYYSKHFR